MNKYAKRAARQKQRQQSDEMRINPVSYPAVSVEDMKFDPPLTEQEREYAYTCVLAELETPHP